MTSLRFLKIVSERILMIVPSQCDVLSAALVFPTGLPQRVDPHIWFGTVFRADAHPHSADISHYQHIYHAPTFSLNIHRDHFFLHITQSRSAVCQIVFLPFFYVVTIVNLTCLTQNLKPHTKTFHCWVICCAFKLRCEVTALISSTCKLKNTDASFHPVWINNAHTVEISSRSLSYWHVLDELFTLNEPWIVNNLNACASLLFAEAADQSPSVAGNMGHIGDRLHLLWIPNAHLHRGFNTQRGHELLKRQRTWCWQMQVHAEWS